MKGKIRILIADDHAVLRAGLKMLLEAQPDMEVVGEAATGKEALELASLLAPDVILLDITMPGMEEFRALRELREKVPSARILILTMHDHKGYLKRALREGASGYVVKKAADVELISAIRAVYRGDLYIHPSVTRALLEDALDAEATRGEGVFRPPPEMLSPREKEILRLVALGYTNSQIAEKLFISVKTVETYKARIKEKLGLKTRAAMVRYALQQGLLKED